VSRGRRLVIAVCPREPGVVRLPVTRGSRARPLDAGAVAAALRALVDAGDLHERVELVEGCAGGCARTGPNVSVTIYPMPRPGAAPDHVAVGWKTYVYSLASLDCLATVIEENLGRRPRSAGEAPAPTPRSGARRRR
jgi:hypothetical protein